jgi:competence protein ComEC
MEITMMCLSFTRKTNYKRFFLSLLAVGLMLSQSAFAWASQSNLRIYFIDVEGGQSTLFVEPNGESLLIDTGWPGNAGRDADRIMVAAKLARLKKIDYVLLTHYHEDHSGGVPQLIEKIPVGTFIDHGANVELKPGNPTAKVFEDYQSILASGRYKRIIAHPGEVLPLSGMKVTAVSSDGQVLDHSLPGGGQANQNCNGPEPKQDRGENGHSLGVLIEFGKTKILDLGDLTRDREKQLMCPVNKLGKIDILVVSHHGFNASSSPALIAAIRPKIAIINNGENKGGDPDVMDILKQSPGLETLWQLHYMPENGDPMRNTNAQYIANPHETDQGNYILVTVNPKGQFKVFNSGTKVSKSYTIK